MRASAVASPTMPPPITIASYDRAMRIRKEEPEDIVRRVQRQRRLERARRSTRFRWIRVGGGDHGLSTIYRSRKASVGDSARLAVRMGVQPVGRESGKTADRGESRIRKRSVR